MRKALQLLLLAPALLWGCDSADPVAPEGSILTLSAAPDRISSNGTSIITVVARKANGFPVNPGTTIHLSTTRGTIPSSAQTDDDGVAEVVLRGNGAIGTAVVKANAGAAEEVMVEVEIGFQAASVTLNATPASIPPNGGVINLLALVRDENGQAPADVLVNFTAELGTLASGGDFVSTDASGRAEDTLRVRASDISDATNDFDVTVEVSGADGKLITRTRTITIQR
jgi:hypothetical protein